MRTAKILTLLSGLLAAPIASAQNAVPPGNDGFTEWGKSGEWVIFVDNERQTCLIEKFDANRNAVQVGLTKDHDHAYLGLFMPLPAEHMNKKEKIILEVNGEQQVTNVPRRNTREGVEYTGTYIKAADLSFAEGATVAKEVVIFEDDEQMSVVFDLSGGEAAVEAAKECNLTLNP